MFPIGEASEDTLRLRFERDFWLLATDQIFSGVKGAEAKEMVVKSHAYVIMNHGCDKCTQIGSQAEPVEPEPIFAHAFAAATVTTDLNARLLTVACYRAMPHGYQICQRCCLDVVSSV